MRLLRPGVSFTRSDGIVLTWAAALLALERVRTSSAYWLLILGGLGLVIYVVRWAGPDAAEDAFGEIVNGGGVEAPTPDVRPPVLIASTRTPPAATFVHIVTPTL